MKRDSNWRLLQMLWFVVPTMRRQLDMPAYDLLQTRYASLRDRLPRIPLASLPTPVREARIEHRRCAATIWIKEDDRTSTVYGGNKVRKLEYLFGRLDRRRCKRVATYGTVASNHALATAAHAKPLGFEPVCLLSHQTRTPLARKALLAHAAMGTELVPFHGDRRARIEIQRKHFADRRTAVIPMGGTSWRGCLGFVAAGLELSVQISSGELPRPHRIYIAGGTLGTVAGLALGLALERLPVDIHAVRVSHTSIANRIVLTRLMAKTCTMLHSIEPSFPSDVCHRARVTLRHEFFGPGYARSTPEAESAIDAVRAAAGIELDTTYTGKAMAAVMADLRELARRRERVLFWNTYSPAAPPGSPDPACGRTALPAAFLSYLD